MFMGRSLRAGPFCLREYSIEVEFAAAVVGAGVEAVRRSAAAF